MEALVDPPRARSRSTHRHDPPICRSPRAANRSPSTPWWIPSSPHRGGARTGGRQVSPALWKSARWRSLPVQSSAQRTGAASTSGGRRTST